MLPHAPDFVPCFRDKTLGGRRPAGDIICIIPPAPPPKAIGAPDPAPILGLPFPPSTMSFPCSFSST